MRGRTLRRGLFFAVLAMVVLLAVVGGGVVGVTAENDHEAFRWDVAAEAATAIGTTFLAMGTVYLGVAAQDATAEARREDLARRTRENEPCLLAGPIEPFVGTMQPQATGRPVVNHVSVDVVNVGRGPAADAQCWISRTSPLEIAFQIPVILPGERITTQLFLNHSATTDPEQFELGGFYLDRDRDPATRRGFGSKWARGE